MVRIKRGGSSRSLSVKVKVAGSSRRLSDDKWSQSRERDGRRPKRAASDRDRERELAMKAIIGRESSPWSSMLPFLIVAVIVVVVGIILLSTAPSNSVQQTLAIAILVAVAAVAVLYCCCQGCRKSVRSAKAVYAQPAVDLSKKKCTICDRSLSTGCPRQHKKGPDSCPLMTGKCGHTFHFHCIGVHLQTSPGDDVLCPVGPWLWEFATKADRQMYLDWGRSKVTSSARRFAGVTVEGPARSKSERRMNRKLNDRRIVRSSSSDSLTRLIKKRGREREKKRKGKGDKRRASADSKPRSILRTTSSNSMASSHRSSKTNTPRKVVRFAPDTKPPATASPAPTKPLPEFKG